MHSCLHIGKMLAREFADCLAGALSGVRQLQKPPDLFERDTQTLCLPQKTQTLDRIFVVTPVTV
jgi:hypothetical protein